MSDTVNEPQQTCERSERNVRGWPCRRTLHVEMGYAIREENVGAYYHVGTRGNNKRPIYSTDSTRQVFLLMLGRLTRRHDWRVVAYCLMGITTTSFCSSATRV